MTRLTDKKKRELRADAKDGLVYASPPDLLSLLDEIEELRERTAGAWKHIDSGEPELAKGLLRPHDR